MQSKEVSPRDFKVSNYETIEERAQRIQEQSNNAMLLGKYADDR